MYVPSLKGLTTLYLLDNGWMNWEIIQSATDSGHCHLYGPMTGDPTLQIPSCSWGSWGAGISKISSFYQDRQIRTHRVPLLCDTSFKVRFSPWVISSLAVKHIYTHIYIYHLFL